MNVERFLLAARYEKLQAVQAAADKLGYVRTTVRSAALSFRALKSAPLRLKQPFEYGERQPAAARRARGSEQVKTALRFEQSEHVYRMLKSLRNDKDAWELLGESPTVS